MNRIYFKDFKSYQEASGQLKRRIDRNAGYDLEPIASPKLREELELFILKRGGELKFHTFYAERARFNQLIRFLNKKAKQIQSFREQDEAAWVRQLKAWMLAEGISLTRPCKGAYGNVSQMKAPLITYLERLLHFLAPEDPRPEREKDIWDLKKLDIPIRENLIKNVSSIQFTRIRQPAIRQELKDGIYRNLHSEAVSCIQREIRAMGRLSDYLYEKKPDVQTCGAIDREIFEDYLIYLKTEDTSKKNYHSELGRLRAILESIGKIHGFPQLEILFLSRDIPPTPKIEFKTYSDAEMKRLNAHIIQMEEQYARAMVIHQLLGTRISDTLTLQTDCLYEKDCETIIRIRQMKTRTYEKPVSAEVAALIRKAIQYTKERYGETTYIFVNPRDTSRPLPYDTIQESVVRMIRKKDLRDDNGVPFGFHTHIYRHNYGMKLTQLHLDDWTIARLLGHNNVQNVKYYRQMSNQTLADETRKVRSLLSEIILENLEGWEEEYEQIRQNACLE